MQTYTKNPVPGTIRTNNPPHFRFQDNKKHECPQSANKTGLANEVVLTWPNKISSMPISVILLCKVSISSFGKLDNATAAIHAELTLVNYAKSAHILSKNDRNNPKSNVYLQQ